VLFSSVVCVVVERARGELGVASRGVVTEIDEQLAVLDGELARYEQLVADRERLVAARAALLGEDQPAAQITWQDVAAYLAEHPGSRAGEIAQALGVPLARVSSHLYRGKRTRFVSRQDGWHVRKQPSADSGSSGARGR
jgi:DNA-directed RNA polymerase specialized sigma24 family protein